MIPNPNTFAKQVIQVKKNHTHAQLLNYLNFIGKLF